MACSPGRKLFSRQACPESFREERAILEQSVGERRPKHLCIPGKRFSPVEDRGIVNFFANVHLLKRRPERFDAIQKSHDVTSTREFHFPNLDTGEQTGGTHGLNLLGQLQVELLASIRDILAAAEDQLVKSPHRNSR